MAYKVRCSACGKSMRLPESDAGLAVVCLACGAKYVAPATDAPGVEQPPPHPVAALLDDGPAAEPAKLEPPTLRPIVPVARPFPWAITAVAAAAVLLIGLLGVVAYFYLGAGLNVSELEAMRDEAIALTDEGDLEGARQKYRELDQLAMQFGTHDPAVKKLADDARAEQERVYAVILAQRVTSPPVPPPTPPAPPAPTSNPTAGPAIAANPDAPATAPIVGADDPVNMDPAPKRVAVAPGVAPSPLPATRPSPTQIASATRPAATAPAVAHQRPALRPIPEPVTAITDEQIGASIQKGVDHLLSLYDPGSGQLRDAGVVGGDEGYVAGLNALCVYALLQSGQAISDPRLDVRGSLMKNLIDGMKRQNATTGKATYARGIRATALALYNRKEDRATLRADVLYLTTIQRDGAYGYAGGGQNGAEPRTPGSSWDNSNTQYGLLGVWSGAEVGAEVPSSYWAAAQKHWAMCQNEDGTWGYTVSKGTLSMTAAGTASLFVADDFAYGSRFGHRVGREPFSKPLQRALDWWEQGDRLSVTATPWWGYTLYGIERVGLASGFKYLGKQDWYRVLAREVVARQQADGTWGDLVDSAYALLFLSRGRHPILMNKLRFDRSGPTGETAGYWANRPRDAANLARYAGRQLERPLNWQVAGIGSDWQDWLDSPILSIASHRAPYFDDAQYDKLRNYVEAGGMIFLQADGDSSEFNAFASRFSAKLFPQYPLEDLPAGHPLLTSLYKLNPGPPLKAVSNGSRLLILYSPKDITRYWQMRDTSGKKELFEFGVNLFVYAAGKRELRNRLSSPYVSPPPANPPLGIIHAVRVKYDGAWDPEPGAWRRFSPWFTRQTGTGLAVDTVSLGLLKPGMAPIAHLTGVTPHEFTAEEVATLREYVEAGGVVFIDSCGGGGPFIESAKAALAQAFPKQTLEPLPKDSPLLQPGPPGMEDLTKSKLRPYVQERLGANTTATLQTLSAGKGVVLLSDYDVTSGLLGTLTWGISGYDPAQAQSLMQNLIFWTVDRAAAAAPTTAPTTVPAK